MALKNKVGLAMCGLVLASLGIAANASAIEFDDRGISEDGKLHVTMVPPTNMSEQYALDEMVRDVTGQGWGITFGGEWNCKSDFSACKLVKVTQESTDWTDDYVDIVYDYDPAAKEKIDELLKDYSVPEDGFFVYDVELMKYWAFGGDNLAAVSSEVKTALEYMNVDFMIDVRGGGDDDLITHNIGEAKVFYNGVLYRVLNNDYVPIVVAAPHIFYVETGSEDLVMALMNRFVAIYGEEARDAVGISNTGKKVKDFVAEDNEFYDYFKDYANANVFEMNVGGGETYLIAIVANSDKIKTHDGVNSTDLLTDINIKTAAENLPGDLMTTAHDMGSDDEGIKEDFGDVFNAYEIGLYSAAMDDMISDSDAGFTVSIPVPEVLKGVENISAYWKNYDSGELEEHRATIVGDAVVFETSHFSTYVLAESTESEEIPEEEGDSDSEDGEVPVPGAPDTGSRISGLSSVAASLPIFGIVMAITGALAFAVVKKSK